MQFTLDFGLIATLGVGLLGTLNAWLLFAIRGLVATLKTIETSNQANTIVATALGVKVDTFIETTRDMRADQKTLAAKVESIAVAIATNTVLTEKAVERADAAFIEANNVNRKIAALGLQVIGGGKLSP